MKLPTTDSLADRLVRGTSASFVGQLVYIGANAALIVLLTREFLDPEGFGRLYFALSVLGVIATFATLGLPQSAARYVNEYLETDSTQLRYILQRSAGLLVALLVGTGLLLALVHQQLAELLGEPDIAPLLLVGAGYVAVHGLSGYLQSVFRGLNRVTWTAFITAWSSLARILLAVGFLLAGFGAMGALLGYIGGYVAAILVGGGVLYWRYYRQYAPTTDPDRSLPRRILRYSVPLTVTKGAGALDNRVDSILVGILVGPVAVGYYVIAKQVGSVVSTPAASFGAALSPAVGKERARSQIARASRLYETSLRHILLFYVPASAGLVFVAEPVVTQVFGAQYLPAVLPLQVFTGVIIVQAVNKITTDTLDYLGRARDRAVSKSVMAVGNVALNLLLIPIYGVVGAVVATVITQAFYALANVYIIHQVLALDVRRVVRDLVVIAAITLGMSLAVFLLVPYVSGLLSLIGVVLFGGAVWAALSVLSGLLDLGRVRSVLF